MSDHNFQPEEEEEEIQYQFDNEEDVDGSVPASPNGNPVLEQNASSSSESLNESFVQIDISSDSDGNVAVNGQKQAVPNKQNVIPHNNPINPGTIYRNISKSGQPAEEEEDFEEEEECPEPRTMPKPQPMPQLSQQQQKQHQSQYQQVQQTDSIQNAIIENNEEDLICASDQKFNSENMPDDENMLKEKFQQFIDEKKQKCVLMLDEGRVNLLPSQLRQPITNIITQIKRWANRNPTGASLSALQILAERLDEFLELQEHREDRNYESRCRDLLSMIYRNTIEAQRLSRQLRDAAAPRSLDEYE